MRVLCTEFDICHRCEYAILSTSQFTWPIHQVVVPDEGETVRCAGAAGWGQAGGPGLGCFQRQPAHPTENCWTGWTQATSCWTLTWAHWRLMSPSSVISHIIIIIINNSIIRHYAGGFFFSYFFFFLFSSSFSSFPPHIHDNNNNNNDTETCNSRFLQSPHCALKRP